MDELLALEEPGLEPAAARARQHLEACEACRTEQARLRQRMARLRALPTLRPARDGWPLVAERVRTARRRTLVRRALAGVGALAAALLLAVALPGTPLRDALSPRDAAALAAERELDQLMQHSQALEAALGAYDPDRRVVDGRTVRVASDLEARIADVDQRMQTMELDASPGRGEAQMLQLWQERVGLLNALVDVHVTSASNVGL
jgi:anti-sigma factor RsiW